MLMANLRIRSLRLFKSIGKKIEGFYIIYCCRKKKFDFRFLFFFIITLLSYLCCQSRFFFLNTLKYVCVSTDITLKYHYLYKHIYLYVYVYWLEITNAMQLFAQGTNKIRIHHTRLIHNRNVHCIRLIHNRNLHCIIVSYCGFYFITKFILPNVQ